MSKNYCPLCYSQLEVRDVAPCFDCGAFDRGIEHALTGQHTFAEWRILGEIKLVLCSFCRIEFYSYFDPGYFGFPSYERFKIALDQMEFVRSVDVYIGKDKFCPHHGRRLAFLEFLQQIRNLNEQSRGAKEGE